jgi:hypothetical protein
VAKNTRRASPKDDTFSVEGLLVHAAPLHPCRALFLHSHRLGSASASGERCSPHGPSAGTPPDHRRRRIGLAMPASRNHGGAADENVGSMDD